jgi:F-type H+-transporting ATPase subunit b
MEKLIEEFSIGLFFWQTVIFVILIFLLKKVAWRPILKAVNDREQGIKDALQSAELAKKEMESLKADNDKIMKLARVERDTLLKEARGIKNSIVSQAKDEAKAEAQKIIENANESIKNEKNAAVSEIKKQVATLSIDIAEKILKEKLSDDDKQMQIVEELLKDVKLK